MTDTTTKDIEAALSAYRRQLLHYIKNTSTSISPGYVEKMVADIRALEKLASTERLHEALEEAVQ